MVQDVNDELKFATHTVNAIHIFQFYSLILFLSAVLSAALHQPLTLLS